MKKAEVEIGGKYYAKVTNKRVEIRIDAERPRGGWDATNLATGKKIYIKSAQRLQGAASDSTRPAETKAEESTDDSQPVSSDGNGTAVAVLKKPRKAKVTSQGEASDKKLSCIAAALKVLGESPNPMNTQEMIAAMQAKGYWSSPGGMTPHATLYSAILRDLSKDDESRFVKTERGRFTTRS